MNYIVLDVETNGIGTFRPPRQCPIQVSFQHITADGRVLSSYSEFIKGVKKITWGGSIGECPWTTEFVNAKGVSIASCVKALKECINKDSVIVGHNIEFDVGIILNAFHSRTVAHTPIFCTMKSTTDLCSIRNSGFSSKQGGYKWPKLIELATKLNINLDNSNFHDSAYDVEITKQCFLALIKRDFIPIPN
jgi:DNA polymerase III alpha subunit (gram-positive type)